jgi:branched-chain amino acid transport system permease protein
MSVKLPMIAISIFFSAWLFLPDFTISLLDYVGIYAIVVLGLVIMTGVAGMTSFGQAAFVGIGAYATAWVTTSLFIADNLVNVLDPSFLPWVGLVFGLMITYVLAWFLGLITLNLSGFYLPLCTLAWGLSFYYLFGNLEFLGGHTGITGIPPLSISSYSLSSPRSFGYVIWLIFFLMLWLMYNLLDSRVGRAIQSLKSGRLMAESMGINTSSYRAKVFMLAALMASTSGWLYSHFQRFVNPTPFNLSASIDYLFMAVIGGAAYLWAAVLGSALVAFIKSYLQDIIPSIFGSNINPESIIFGLIMLFILQYYPNGLWPGLVKFFLSSVKIKKKFNIEKYEPSKLNSRNMPPKGTLILDAKEITKCFGGLVANRSVSLDLKAGEIHALIGPNGAGKSTIFNILSGVDFASEGQVELLGESMRGKVARDFATRGLGRTFQHVRLLRSQSVLDNVALGAHLRGHFGWLACMLRLDRREECAIQLEATEQIRRCGLAGSENAIASSLSLGKQRIVEIARALSGQPVALLLDEPAAGLRHLEKKDLASLLMQLRLEGLSILIIEHDMEFVMQLADRITVLDFGTVIATGSPQEIQKNSRVLDAYLGIEEQSGGSL